MAPVTASLPPHRPRVASTLAALTALAALFLTCGGSFALPLMGVALLATHLTDRRLPNRAWLRWTLRLSLAGVAVAAGTDLPTHGADTFIAARTMDWFGQACAMELVIHHWLRHPPSAMPAQTTTLLSGLVLLAASHTAEGTYMPAAAPAYVLFTVLALLDDPAPAVRRGNAWVAPAIRWGALGLAMGLGAGTFLSIRAHRAEITGWGNQILFGRPSDTAGMSTAPVLGRTFRLRGELTRVLRLVGITARDGGGLHLRGMSFHRYGRGRWTPLLGDRRLEPAPLVRGGRRATQLRITRLAENGGLLFLPLDTAAIEPLGVRDIRWSPDHSSPLRTEEPPPTTCAVTLAPPGTVGLLARPPQAAQRERLLALPPDLDPRVRDLARQAAGGGAGITRVRAVERYLQTRHAYSLSIDPGRGDPVTGFLLGRKAAHCEYFASAAVLLLRCVGVPARYVTGYYAHERAGDGLVVRQRDAHAWAEAWVEGTGWVTVEATPGDGRPDRQAEPVPFWTRAKEWLQDTAQAARDLPALLARPASLGIIAGVGVLLAALVWRRSRRRRRARRSIAYSGAGRELAALGARFERFLRRRGVPCPADRTWQEHLAAISDPGAPKPESAVEPFDLPKATAFLAEYNKVRFGGPEGAAAAGRLERLLRDLERDPPASRQPAGAATGEDR